MKQSIFISLATLMVLSLPVLAQDLNERAPAADDETEVQVCETPEACKRNMAARNASLVSAACVQGNISQFEKGGETGYVSGACRNPQYSQAAPGAGKSSGAK